MIAGLIKNKKGMTLLEVLVAVFILAIVIVPLMSIFASNIKVTKQAAAITDSSYTAQSLAEELYPLSHSSLFAAQRTKAAYGGKYATVAVKPAGTPSGLAAGSVCYAHLILNGSSAVFAGPDGQYKTGSSSGVKVTATSGGYSVTGGISLTGTKPSGTMILLVNSGAAAFSGTVTVTVSGAAAALYHSPTQDVKVTGASAMADYSNDVAPNKMLVDVLVAVYDKSTDTTPSSTVQSTVEALVR